MSLGKSFTKVPVRPEFAEDLVEALDGQGRFLCVLPAASARGQKLTVRAIAALARTSAGASLLAECGPRMFDATVFTTLRAGRAHEAWAEAMLEGLLGFAPRLRPLGAIDHDGAWGACRVMAYEAIYSHAFIKSVSSSTLLLADEEETRFLANNGLLTPLCERLLRMAGSLV